MILIYDDYVFLLLLLLCVTGIVEVLFECRTPRRACSRSVVGADCECRSARVFVQHIHDVRSCIHYWAASLRGICCTNQELIDEDLQTRVHQALSVRVRDILVANGACSMIASVLQFAMVQLQGGTAASVANSTAAAATAAANANSAGGNVNAGTRPALSLKDSNHQYTQLVGRVDVHALCVFLCAIS